MRKGTTVSSQRNQSIECARLLAAVLVVFIHCRFPGIFGGYVECLGRYAVPLFFVISGFFSFGISGQQILGRLKSILKLYLLAEFMYLIWNIFATEYAGGSTVAYLRSAVPEIDEAARLLFLNVPPYVGHLWYLLAMAGCYLGLLLYVRFFEPEPVDYRPLYLIGAFLLADHITTAAVLGEIETENPVYWCRSGLLFGMPMFAMGLFLGQYRQRLFEKFNLTTPKLLALVLGSVVLSAIQWRGGIDSGCMEFGTMLGVPALMLLLTAHPVVTEKAVPGKWIGRLGKVSMAVYILHLMVIQGYELLLLPVMGAGLGEWEPWLRPLLVLSITLAAAVLYERMSVLTGKRRRSK